MEAAQYLVDPTLRKLSQYLDKLNRAVVEIYLGVLFAVANVWLILMGGVLVLAAVVIPVQDLHGLGFSVVMLPVGVGWVASRSFRKMTWQFFGVAVLWTIVLTVALQPFINPQSPQSLLVQIALATAYLVPPLVATAIVVKLQKQR